MTQGQIEPHRITKPFQLAGAWFTALILLEGSILTAATQVDRPSWAPSLLLVTAVILLFVVVLVVFLLQTKFRPHMQEDRYYAQWLETQKKAFSNFSPEDVQVSSAEPPDRRASRYEENRGLFLVHNWRPSTQPGQAADIVVRLHQHNNGPLTQRTIRKVSYDLGPKFADAAIEKTNGSENFRLDVSAYGPMLCLATVEFTDGHPPIELERYIDFG